jgi:large subunit ribosomal protein L22
VRYVIDMVRTKSVPAAQAILAGSPRRGADIIKKLLDQAVDAAKKNSQVEAKDLYISCVTADGGPTMKRFRAMSMGRAGVIRKRTSHIYLALDVKNKSLLNAPTGKAAKSGKVIAPPVAKKESGKKKLAGAR